MPDTAKSGAAVVLEKALFFLDQARHNKDVDRFAYTSNVEAAIVFARSVTLHLQKDFAHSPGFQEWYASQQHALQEDRLGHFLLNQRNFILKVRAVQTKRVVEAELIASMHATATFTARVIRARPWYMRHPKILYEDATYPLRAWAARARARRQALERARTAASSGRVVSDEIFFDHPDWSNTPAIDLIARHLDKLGAIVSEAETRFVSPSDGPSESSTA